MNKMSVESECVHLYTMKPLRDSTGCKCSTGTPKEKHVVYQGVIIFAGFEKSNRCCSLWGAELQCRDNAEQGAYLRQPVCL